MQVIEELRLDEVLLPWLKLECRAVRSLEVSIRGDGRKDMARSIQCDNHFSGPCSGMVTQSRFMKYGQVYTFTCFREYNRTPTPRSSALASDWWGTKSQRWLILSDLLGKSIQPRGQSGWQCEKSLRWLVSCRKIAGSGIVRLAILGDRCEDVALQLTCMTWH